MAAAQARVEDHPLADSRALDVFSSGSDDAHSVRAKDMRHLQLCPAQAHPDVQVVQARTKHLQHHLPRSRHWNLDLCYLHYVQTAVLTYQCRSHTLNSRQKVITPAHGAWTTRPASFPSLSHAAGEWR